MRGSCLKMSVKQRRPVPIPPRCGGNLKLACNPANEQRCTLKHRPRSVFWHMRMDQIPSSQPVAEQLSTHLTADPAMRSGFAERGKVRRVDRLQHLSGRYTKMEVASESHHTRLRWATFPDFIQTTSRSGFARPQMWGSPLVPSTCHILTKRWTMLLMSCSLNRQTPTGGLV